MVVEAEDVERAKASDRGKDAGRDAERARGSAKDQGVGRGSGEVRGLARGGVCAGPRKAAWAIQPPHRGGLRCRRRLPARRRPWHRWT